MVNLLYGEVVEVFERDGESTGTIRVGTALKVVSLMFVPGIRPGEKVLVSDGVAIGTITEDIKEG